MNIEIICLHFFQEIFSCKDIYFVFQTAVESVTMSSPKRPQRTVRGDFLVQDSGRNSQDQSDESKVTGSPSKNDSRRVPSQVITRGKHRSGQSDADVSEAESTTSNSSTRVTRSRQSLGSITDSARKLRNHRSAIITEPILESKEDEELSEAESNCSSVSTRASRKMRASASHSTRARSRKSAFLSEQVSDHSEAESNCSSVSLLQNTAIRSTRTSEAIRPLSINSELQKDELSEAESCSSQTQARRSSRRIQSKPRAGDSKSVCETSSQEQDSPKKQRYSLRGIKVIETLSSVQEQNILSTPQRSLRNRIVNECDDIVLLSDTDSRSKGFSSKDACVDQPKSEESLKDRKSNLSVEESSVLNQKLPETSQSTINYEVIDLTEEMDEPQLKDQDKAEDDGDSEAADITNKDLSNLNKETQSGPSNVTKGVEISLMLESDESEESEHSEEESDIEMQTEEIQEELEEDHEDLVKTKKPKNTLTEQSQDAVDDGLFIIDTAPGLDSSKKYYVDGKGSEREQSENESEEELPEPDEEEDFMDEEVDDGVNEEEELLNQTKSGL